MEMKINNCKFEFTTGNGILNHISNVANFRLKYFRDFPYLYQGDLDYEIKYLDGYAQDSMAALVQVTNEKGELKAVSTALPLSTCSGDGKSRSYVAHGRSP